MSHTAHLVCLVSTVGGCHKNALGRGCTSRGNITKLEQSTFHRYLWETHKSKRQTYEHLLTYKNMAYIEYREFTVVITYVM